MHRSCSEQTCCAASSWLKNGRAEVSRSIVLRHFVVSYIAN